jgi:Ser/Thr protein kinase RdoA (MazF antagonist)
MEPMRVIHTIPHPEEVARVVASEYEIAAPVTAKLLRRGFNDTYLIKDATDALWTLRLYARDKYWVSSEGDLLFELELLDYLAGQGLPVSHPLPRRSGEWLGRVQAAEGERYFALFTYAEGMALFHRPLEPDGHRSLGALIGRLHGAMDGFRSGHSRYEIGFDVLIDIPLRMIEPYAGDEPAYRELCDLGARLKAAISALELPPDAFALIHTDLHGGNIHATSEGDLTIFDFDHCGFGWRAYDLTNFYSPPGSDGKEVENWEALLAGYQSVRPLTGDESSSLPLFAACRQIWDRGDMLRAAHWYGDSWATELLAEQVLKRAKASLEHLGW